MASVLVHAVIWLLTRSLFPIGVDYLLLWPLARRLGAVSFVALGLLTATLHVLLVLFYLDRGISAVDLAEMVLLDTRLAAIALALVAALIAALLVDRLLLRRLPVRAAGFSFIAVSAVVAGLYLAYKTHRFDVQPVFSPAATLARRLPDPEWREWMSAHSLRRTMAVPSAQPSRTYQSILAASSQRPAGILLMHVESWGLPKDPRALDALLASLQARHPSHRFSLHSEPFHAFTLTNEARVLCDLDIGSLYFRPSAAQAADCLPAQLRSRGWQTVAVHNNRADFYHRNQWYPGIGFDQFIDRALLQQAGLPFCALAFDTPCDRAVADWIDRRTFTEPYFLYWMSIDAHLPISAASQRTVADPSQASSHCPLSDPHCLADVQWALAEQSVLAFFELLHSRPNVVMIAKGDHRPYFYNAERGRYSADEVPVLIAEPVAAPPIQVARTRR